MPRSDGTTWNLAITGMPASCAHWGAGLTCGELVVLPRGGWACISTHYVHEPSSRPPCNGCEAEQVCPRSMRDHRSLAREQRSAQVAELDHVEAFGQQAHIHGAFGVQGALQAEAARSIGEADVEGTAVGSDHRDGGVRRVGCQQVLLLGNGFFNAVAARYVDHALHAHAGVDGADVPRRSGGGDGEVRAGVGRAHTELETTGQQRGAVHIPRGLGDLRYIVVVLHTVVPSDVYMVAQCDGERWRVELIVLHHQLMCDLALSGDGERNEEKCGNVFHGRWCLFLRSWCRCPRVRHACG